MSGSFFDRLAIRDAGKGTALRREFRQASASVEIEGKVEKAGRAHGEGSGGARRRDDVVFLTYYDV